MADYTITLTTNAYLFDPVGEDPPYWVYETSVSPSSLTIVGGDRVRFRHVNIGSANTSVNIEAFNSALWDVSSDITNLLDAYSPYRTSIDPAIDTIDSINFDVNGGVYPDKNNYNLTVQASTDTLPDPYSLGANATNATPSTIYYSNIVEVSGIDTSVTALVTGSGTFQVNGTGSWVTSATVGDGDTIQVRMTSSSSYSTAVSTILNIGAGSAPSWSVTTYLNQDALNKISINRATSISFDDLRLFFGVYPDNLTMFSNLYRGGSYVPDITETATIPTLGAVEISDYRNTKTTFYVTKDLVNKTLRVIEGVLQTKTAAVGWAITTDWDIGFGIGMERTCERKIEITETSTDKLTSLSITGGSWGVWGYGTVINISKTSQNTRCFGDIKISYRNSLDPTNIITTEGHYSLTIETGEQQ